MFYSNKLKKNNGIQHCFFSRKNGTSKGIYESLNCGIGSKDRSENVQKNFLGKKAMKYCEHICGCTPSDFKVNKHTRQYF